MGLGASQHCHMASSSSGCSFPVGFQRLSSLPHADDTVQVKVIVLGRVFRVLVFSQEMEQRPGSKADCQASILESPALAISPVKHPEDPQKAQTSQDPPTLSSR